MPGIFTGLFVEAICCLTKVGQHVNEMMACSCYKFCSSDLLTVPFIIIRQNVSMATNAMLHCRLTSVLNTGESERT